METEKVDIRFGNPTTLQVGSLVIARRDCAACRLGEAGFCYRYEQRDGGPRWSFIFEGGRQIDLDESGIAALLHPTGRCYWPLLDYCCDDNDQPGRDYRAGVFNRAFALAPAPAAHFVRSLTDRFHADIVMPAQSP
ncbi:MAG: hypothetical protein R3202_03660 [Candidatus Competibacterales bacterium]|nr:hypothetical protein [Candidatus Competibacterales bacterium]